jgi:hypothetical protein
MRTVEAIIQPNGEVRLAGQCMCQPPAGR